MSCRIKVRNTSSKLQLRRKPLKHFVSDCLLAHDQVYLQVRVYELLLLLTFASREGGTGSEDAFLFLLANFTESARLWVRLQQQSSVRDRVKREKERQDLRVLVGSALVRMAQLEGMTVDFYKTQALPAILQQVRLGRGSNS